MRKRFEAYAWTLLGLTLAVTASPASAQWTRVTQVPAVTLFSVSAKGDTIVTTADSIVFVSTNAGATWKRSSRVTTDGLQVQQARVRNGRIYAGSRRKGVFVSTNLGDTWSDFNQGLAGGCGGSQLATIDMLVREGSIDVALRGGRTGARDLRA